MTTEGGGGRRARVPASEPESVIAHFNRSRQVAGELLRENEQLRSRITRLEDELRRHAAKTPRPDEGERE